MLLGRRGSRNLSESDDLFYDRGGQTRALFRIQSFRIQSREAGDCSVRSGTCC